MQFKVYGHAGDLFEEGDIESEIVKDTLEKSEIDIPTAGTLSIQITKDIWLNIHTSEWMLTDFSTEPKPRG